MKYVISNRHLQDELRQSLWKRDWVWSICRIMLARFPERFTPPHSENIDIQKTLTENIAEHLTYLNFDMVNQQWKFRMRYKGHEEQLEVMQPPEEQGKFAWNPHNEFAWKMMIPSRDVIEVYVALFSCHINDDATFDYEHFNFEHDEINELFDWNWGRRFQLFDRNCRRFSFKTKEGRDEFTK